MAMGSVGYALFWLALAVVMLGIEIGTVSLVSIWFVAGALAAALLAFFHVSLWIQIAAFLGVSAVLFFFFKEKIADFFRFRHDRSGATQVLGQIGIVLQEIHPGLDGRIRVGGLDWKAASHETLLPGDKVRVTAMHGVTLDVQKYTAPSGQTPPVFRQSSHS